MSHCAAAGIGIWIQASDADKHNTLPLVLLTVVSALTCTWLFAAIGVRRLLTSFFDGYRQNIAVAEAARWTVPEIKGWDLENMGKVSRFHVKAFSADQA